MSLDHKRGVWLRIPPVVLGTGLFYVVLRGLPLNLLRAAIIRMRVGSFLAAVILYGLIFIPAAWRWHLILKLAQKAAGFIHTLRTSLIGHFFYTICFGVVGGDSAKAVV